MNHDKKLFLCRMIGKDRPGILESVIKFLSAELEIQVIRCRGHCDGKDATVVAQLLGTDAKIERAKKELPGKIGKSKNSPAWDLLGITPIEEESRYSETMLPYLYTIQIKAHHTTKSSILSVMTKAFSLSEMNIESYVLESYVPPSGMYGIPQALHVFRVRIPLSKHKNRLDIIEDLARCAYKEAEAIHFTMIPD